MVFYSELDPILMFQIICQYNYNVDVFIICVVRFHKTAIYITNLCLSLIILFYYIYSLPKMSQKVSSYVKLSRNFDAALYHVYTWKGVYRAGYSAASKLGMACPLIPGYSVPGSRLPIRQLTSAKIAFCPIPYMISVILLCLILSVVYYLLILIYSRSYVIIYFIYLDN